jgi:hypothetical protein
LLFPFPQLISVSILCSVNNFIQLTKVTPMQLLFCFSNKLRVNNYNVHCLKTWRANIGLDILFVRDAYACAAYITSCVPKSCRGMSYFKQHAQKGNWDKETSSSSLGTFATNLFFASSYCSASNRLSFTLFARERGFTAIAVLLGFYVSTSVFVAIAAI